MDSLLIENKKYNLNNIEWKPSTDGPKELNPIVYINGKMYRPRVETLVFNKEGKVLCINNTPPTKFGTTYYLPGGGFSKEREPIKQAYKECQEEAKINITNIKDTGLVQIADFHGNYPDWHKKKLWPMGIKYEGSVTLIFVADYKSPYKGYIREIDKDDFYKSAKFVDPDEVKWIPEHKQAIEFYRKSLHENVEILDESAVEFIPMNSIENITEENNTTDLEKAKNIGIDTSFLENENLKESVDDLNNYQAALEVWKQLSHEEQLLCSPRGRYVDSPNLITRSIHKAPDGKPVAFADAYKYFGANKNAFVIIAILPAYRGKGIGKELIDSITFALKGKYKNMFWRLDKSNIASAKLAQKLGFTLYKQTKNSITYIKKV